MESIDKMNSRILVATHKKYKMPKEEIYLPLHVGKNGKEGFGFLGDDTGDNISFKNFYFNEMTAVYWAWKNVNFDYIGICHYRRYFTTKPIYKKIFFKDKFSMILDEIELNKIIKEGNEIILPNRRKYYIETIESHYRHLPYTINSDLDALRDVISQKYSDYAESFEKVMRRTWAHMFNMYIMRKDRFNEFAEWAFDVLFSVDKIISIDGRSPIEARMYISEFLIDTWIETKKYPYKEIPIIFMENEHLLKKIIHLILRKLCNNLCEEIYCEKRS